jgi:NADH:ubiquinone reductase (H+-translocating)
MAQLEAVKGSSAPHRIVVLGGGFGGVQVARHLERLCRGKQVAITLVNRDNFFLVTPLLFEAFSGVLELRHCSVPIRSVLHRTRFIESSVEQIDLERRVVYVRGGTGAEAQVPYDQLVLALGAATNESLIPGSEHALTFKTLADAIALRNQVIERFERADAEPDAAVRSKLLTFVIVGGGLVGIELLGELSAFVDTIMARYPTLSRRQVRFLLFEYSPQIMSEIDPQLTEYARALLERRPGVMIRTSTQVKAIEPGAVELLDERIEAGTVVLVAGTAPSEVVADLPLKKGKQGHVIADATMRTERPEVWALGDCSIVPGPDGKPYPYLAQHALREANQLARNVAGAIGGVRPSPFVFSTLGMMASLGHNRAVARLRFVRLCGVLAWFIRRTYYLLQTPGFDRKLRIVVDWTLALVLPTDVVKVDLSKRSLDAVAPSTGGATEALTIGSNETRVRG